MKHNFAFLSRAWALATELPKSQQFPSDDERHTAQFAVTAFTILATICATAAGLLPLIFNRPCPQPLLCALTAACAGSAVARSRHYAHGLRLISAALLIYFTISSGVALRTSSPSIPPTFYSSHIMGTLISVVIPCFLLSQYDAMVFGLLSLLCTCVLPYASTIPQPLALVEELSVPACGIAIALCLASAFRHSLHNYHLSQRLKLEKSIADVRAAKTAFAATLSHEFRSPLHGINGFAEMLVDDESLSDTSRDWANQILSSIRVLLSVANQVLDYTRIENGKFVAHKEETNVRKVIEDVLQVCAVSTTKNVDLLYTVSPDFPELVLTDTTRVQQVIMNLVGNATKFTSHGEILVRVSATQLSDDEDTLEDRILMQIDVEDTGAGMTEEQLSHLFIPYELVDPVLSRRRSGAGLGLPISRDLCQLLGGDLICFKSAPGVGTTFRATVPVYGTLQKAIVPPVSLDGRRVAIASTRPVALEIMSGALSESGAACMEWAVPAAVMASQTYLEWMMERLALQPLDNSAEVLVIDFPSGAGIASTLSSQREEMGFVVVAHASELHGLGRHRARGVRLLRKPIKIGALVNAVVTSSLDRTISSSDSFFSQINTPASALSSRSSPQEGQQQSRNSTPPVSARVLVIEDESQRASSTLVSTLQQVGTTVDHVSNPIEAIRHLSRGENYGAVMLSLPLTSMSPENTAKSIRELSVLKGKPRIPIIALTPAFISDVVGKYLSYGMDDVVSKNQSVGELGALLQRWVSTSRQ